MTTQSLAHDLAELKREVAELRSDVDHALRMIGHLIKDANGAAPSSEQHNGDPEDLPDQSMDEDESHINGQLATRYVAAWHGD